MPGFGERFRKLRRNRDLTQVQIAEFCGIKPAAVAKWESNENAYPSVPVLVKLAEHFQVSTDYLLRGIHTVPVSESVVNNSDVSNSVVQTNVQSSVQGGIVMNTRANSLEATELLNIYKRLNGRERIKLLSFAYDLDESGRKGLSS